MINKTLIRKVTRSRWSYLALIIASLLGASLIYQLNPHSSIAHTTLREDLEDTVRLVTIVSFFFALLNWMGSEQDKRRNLSLDEAEKFLAQYSAYRASIEAKHIDDFAQYCNNSQASQDQESLGKLRQETNSLLRKCEKLSLGVEYGMLDDRLLQMLLVKIFQEIYNINDNYIESEQILNPGRWIHFKSTAFRWHQELPRIDREARKIMRVTKRMKARMKVGM